MKEEIRAAIIVKIKKAHERQPNRKIEENAERLADDILSRNNFELREGKITNRHGIIQPIGEIIETYIQAAPYVLADPADNKFQSKFIKPSAEARKKMEDETEKVLLKLSELDSIVPLDPDNYTRSLGIIAKNFLFETTQDGEVLFAKFNDGIIHPEARVTWEDLKGNIGHLIDGFRTSFKQELKNASRRAMATQLLGDSVPTNKAIRKGAKTPVYVEGEQPKELNPIAEKMNVIRKNEILASIPHRVLPSISKSELIREAQRAEVARQQWGDFDAVINGGGQRLHLLNQHGKSYMEHLQNTNSIMNKLREIQPQPVPQFEGISY